MKDNSVVLHLWQRHDVFPSFHRKTDVTMPPVCHVDARIIDHPFLVFVDSGATFLLLPSGHTTLSRSIADP